MATKMQLKLPSAFVDAALTVSVLLMLPSCVGDRSVGWGFICRTDKRESDVVQYPGGNGLWCP